MLCVDYHVHTPLCNHASGNMEASVRRAVALGLAEMAFLEHLTLRGDGSHLSLAPREVPPYFFRVKSLARKFAGQISIRAGLEVDFDPDGMEEAEAILNTLDFDVIGASVHFAGGRNLVSRRTGKSGPREDGDAVVESYLDVLERLVEWPFANMACHLDVVKKFGRAFPGRHEQRILGILSAMAQNGLALELNTSGWRHPVESAYPGDWILSKALEKGIPITPGSDAHGPEEVGAGLSRAHHLLWSLGFREITAWKKRKPKPLALVRPEGKKCA